MLCKECGSDVSSSEVFCPNCGAPLRVTADYDYIQAEIGVKVDQFLNDDPEETDHDSFSCEPETEPENEPAPAHTIKVPPVQGQSAAGGGRPPQNRQPERRRENKENTIAITRTLYVKDSIFGDEEAPDFEEEIERGNVNDRRTPRNVQKRREAEKKKKRRRTILISVLVAIAAAIAVLVIILTGGKKETPKEISDVITCSVEDGGTYTTPIEITLWSENDYRIVYTTDGSEPSISGGTRYGSPITYTNTDVKGDSKEITLTAYSYTTQSSIKAGELVVTFTLTKSELAAPVFSHGSGDYYEATRITITAEPDATIYYTYDGSTPSESSTKYTGPIDMKRGNYVLSAVAVDESGVVSEVASAIYNLIIESNITYDEALTNVLDTMVDQGLIESKELDENGYYKVPGGGTRRVINGGEALIDNTNYYVIQVDYMNDGSNVQATTYFGVNDQTGVVTRLNKSGMTFVLG